MLRQYELIDRVRSYAPNCDEALLNRAYFFAMKSGGSEALAAGDPYFSHPTEMAGILADMRLDDEAIAAALLYNTAGEIAGTIEQIEREFGSTLAQLLTGVIGLSKINLNASDRQSLSNLRRFLDANNDVRAMLIKLAERLQKLRSIALLTDSADRRGTAREAMDIYAPIAERMGLHHVMAEMHDRAFRELEPEASESLAKRLELLRGPDGDSLADITSSIDQLLSEHGIEANIIFKEKSAYQIWRKMSERHVSFQAIHDTVVFQISVQDVPRCYQALGIIQQRWPMIQGRFKDYISTPKRNGYRALHTEIMHGFDARIQIQIGTPEMRLEADLGVAARWAGLDQNRAAKSINDWAGDLIEIVQHPDRRDERDQAQTDLSNAILVYSPKGQMWRLPKGAMPLDFAYDVHAELGHHTAGAKVNGRIVALRTKLQNGDQVEILRSASQEPQPNWLNMVVTRKARDAISHYLRDRLTEGAAAADSIETRSDYCLTPRAVEHLLRKVSSPQIVARGSQLDAINGAYEVADRVPLEWLPRHLRDCALVLHDAIAPNAPNLLKTPLAIYAQAIDENVRAPIIQTLVFCAAMIERAMADPDFDNWATLLRPNFGTFLADHQKMIDHFPELEAREAALVEIPINPSADIGAALSEFLISGGSALTMVIDSRLATDRAKRVLEQQLQLARSVTDFDAPLHGTDEKDMRSNHWTQAHDQAVNSLGVWIQVRDALDRRLSDNDHAPIRSTNPDLATAIARFIDKIIHLAK